MKTLRLLNDLTDYWLLRFALACQECFCRELNKDWVRQYRRLHIKLYGRLPA